MAKAKPPKPPKPKDVRYACALNVLSWDQRLGAEVFDPYVEDAGQNALGLRQALSFHVSRPPGPQEVSQDLGLRQSLSWGVTSPHVAPGPQEVSQDLGLRQSLSWGVVAPTGPPAVNAETSIWWQTHVATFNDPFSTNSPDDVLASSVLLVLAHVDPSPPTSRGAAMARLASILAGTEGLEALGRVLD